jgi:hypothetical protein
MNDDEDRNAESWLVKFYEVDQQRLTALDNATLVVKGWALTLISALTGVAVSRDDASFILIAFVPTVFFAALDLHYRGVQLRHARHADQIEKHVRSSLPEWAAGFAGGDARRHRWSYVPVFLFYAPLIAFEAVLIVLVRWL